MPFKTIKLLIVLRIPHLKPKMIKVGPGFKDCVEELRCGYLNPLKELNRTTQVFPLKTSSMPCETVTVFVDIDGHCFKYINPSKKYALSAQADYLPMRAVMKIYS
ncbi:MAG TPA: hypothetical protein EYP68_00125 [Candidatus Korarchaeota archaeon]|nr:hypothetical protein [Candidatus Korarchaeota archaeon]